MKTKSLFVFFLTLIQLYAEAAPVATSRILKNGLKVIVSEKTGNDFVRLEVWYRTGSKDETPGIRGMAHLFEHMMFRGTNRISGDSLDRLTRSLGGNSDATTSFDRTLYYESVPVEALETMMDMEADRMQHLVVTQAILDKEREVVGEELRIQLNSWAGKMNAGVHKLLYPAGHPYEVDVIGNLEEITSFTSEQCMDFYRKNYTPSNAFIVVVGNVNAEKVFSLAEKYFGPIPAREPVSQIKNIPDVYPFQIRGSELPIGIPVQVYSYVFPRPSGKEEDFFPLMMLTNILFLDGNSILKTRIVTRDHLAYEIAMSTEPVSYYPSMGVIDIVMNAAPGNAKVKKAVREEIDKVIADGVPSEKIDGFIRSYLNQETLSYYESASIAEDLGNSEMYFGDYSKAFETEKILRKITNDDLKRVAQKYFSQEHLQVINVKPQ